MHIICMTTTFQIYVLLWPLLMNISWFPHIVHGFKMTSYSVLEDEDLEVVFSLNVKGTPETLRLPLITGVVTSQPGTARKLLLCNPKKCAGTFLAQ